MLMTFWIKNNTLIVYFRAFNALLARKCIIFDRKPDILLNSRTTKKFKTFQFFKCSHGFAVKFIDIYIFLKIGIELAAKSQADFSSCVIIKVNQDA